MRWLSRYFAVLLPLLVVWGCAARHPADLDSFRRLLEAGGEPPAETLIVTFFEVGVGDAILVEFPGGQTLLVDAGVGWYVDSILTYLEARGIERLDGLLLTHPHYDHYGGMPRVAETVPVEVFYSNGVLSSLPR